MWLMTPGGFVSVVEKPSDRQAGTLTVRARDLTSLRAFCRAAGIEQDRAAEQIETDYPFRLVATRAEVERALLSALEGVRYTNFKNAAKAARGKTYATFLGKVWSAGLSLTPRAVQARVDALWLETDRRYSHAGRRVKGSGKQRSVHSLTEDEWEQLMQEEPGV